MILDQDWLFSSENYICDIRTVGVLLKDKKILVQREKMETNTPYQVGISKLAKHWKTGLFVNSKKKQA